MDRKTASRTIGLVVFWTVILLSLPLVAGFFGRLHPAFDSFAHFRVHLAILLALAALPLLATRSFRLHGLLGAALGCAAALQGMLASSQRGGVVMQGCRWGTGQG